MKVHSLLCPALFLCGCAFSTPHPTSMTLSPQAMEIIGPAKGESSHTRVLCVLPVDAPASLAAAAEKAAESVDAEAIVNPLVDDERGVGLLGLWCWQKIKIYGTAVRFKRSQVSGRSSEGSITQAKTEVEAVNDLEKRLLKKGR